MMRGAPQNRMRWRLDLPDGCTACVVDRRGVFWWHLHQKEGAEVVGTAVDVQSARILAILAWRDATGLDVVPDDLRRAAWTGEDKG